MVSFDIEHVLGSSDPWSLSKEGRVPFQMGQVPFPFIPSCPWSSLGLMLTLDKYGHVSF
jgi:hypothetical protein